MLLFTESYSYDMQLAIYRITK